MTVIPVNLATEDELSEVVLRRILRYVDCGYSIGTAYRKGGFGYLRRTITGWNRAAKGNPFVLLTDLDTDECPRALIDAWLPEPQHPNLIFRVAVREVEAWLLADSKNLSRHLAVTERFFPADPDSIPDPKAVLIDAARHSRSKTVRDCIVPKEGSTAKQGPDYNGTLVAFVSNEWDVQAAMLRSPSLRRSVSRLAKFRPTW